jgi:hypothetical protein
MHFPVVGDKAQKLQKKSGRRTGQNTGQTTAENSSWVMQCASQDVFNKSLSNMNPFPDII